MIRLKYVLNKRGDLWPKNVTTQKILWFIIQIFSSNINGLDTFQDKSIVRLNLNLNVEIENSKPQRLTLPQGDLILMFVPNENDLQQDQMEEFMEFTSSETNIARTPNGVLFMSWANDGDYEEGNIISKKIFWKKSPRFFLYL